RLPPGPEQAAEAALRAFGEGIIGKPPPGGYQRYGGGGAGRGTRWPCQGCYFRAASQKTGDLSHGPGRQHELSAGSRSPPDNGQNGGGPDERGPQTPEKGDRQPDRAPAAGSTFLLIPFIYRYLGFFFKKMPGRTKGRL